MLISWSFLVFYCHKFYFTLTPLVRCSHYAKHPYVVSEAKLASGRAPPNRHNSVNEIALSEQVQVHKSQT